MIGIGILGIGFMGSAHFHALKKVRGGEVVALVTRDAAKRAGDWTSIMGNYGTAGGKVDLANVSTYSAIGELLADPRVDLVDVCLPTSAHRDAAIRALDAGKHVLVEKPIALTTQDAREMQAAAEANGRLLLVAHVLHFMAPYRLLRSVLDQPDLDAFGLSLGRFVSAPWQEPAWQQKLQDSGGPVFDLLVHDVDFVRSVLGAPLRVTASGRQHHGHGIYYHALLDYGPNRCAVNVSGGVTGMPGRPLEQRFSLHAHDLTFMYDSATDTSPMLTRRGEELEALPLTPGDPIADELQYVVDAVSGEHSGELLAASGASRSLAICEAVAESLSTGRSVAVQNDAPDSTLAPT